MVFIDAQNFYRGARRAFFDSNASFVAGQYHPTSLGELLASRDPGRELTEVRLYTGRPDPRFQPKSHHANVRQCAAWEASGCFVSHRPVRYLPSESAGGRPVPMEKGIDVALAVDLISLAIRGTYDIGVLCTADSDLGPAVEAVLDTTDCTVEVAAWRGPGPPQRLSLPDRNVWCHWLRRADYDQVCDETDYTV
ncbi:MAG: NYN domain-containing protein [Dehalococcoidia bacterium]|nr:NYN domain-containing protein [Dehalococcoidia bacterium]